MNFEDVSAHIASGYYLVPNETTEIWRDLVKNLPGHINRAAAICSSGEVGLIAMLPTVRKELVLVDHSYNSLSVAMLKYVMLRELGAAETRRLLTTAGKGDVRSVIDKLLPSLPESIRKAYIEGVVRDGRSYEGDFEVVKHYDRYNPHSRRIGTGEVNQLLRVEWNKLPKRALYRCSTKLDRVKFVHGDLSEMVKQGPFDVIYLSNAMDHTNHKGERPQLAQVADAVRPGGHVLIAYRKHYSRYGDDKISAQTDKLGWEEVEGVKEDPKVGMYSWTHGLFQVPTEVPAEVKQEVASEDVPVLARSDTQPGSVVPLRTTVERQVHQARQSFGNVASSSVRGLQQVK